MLGALAPSAIEVSLQVAEDLELERQQLHRAMEAAAGAGGVRDGAGAAPL